MVGLLVLLTSGVLVKGAAARNSLVSASASLLQPTAQLVTTEGGAEGQVGTSVSLAGDGRTALVGAPADTEGRGSAWVFVRSETGWTPRGTLLEPDETVGTAELGCSVALSADGDVAIVGGIADNGSRGAAWIFTRSGNTWTQSGPKLEPSDADSEPHNVLFGASVALSADGSTALVGGYGDRYGGYGAAWVFVRSGNTWVQQGAKLTPASEQLGADGFYSWFGFSVSLSADGDTALIGGEHDEEETGAAWVFVRSGTEWAQQGPKLTSGGSGQQLFGDSVSLSADGDTALIGAEEANGGAGAVSTFVREGSSWARAGTPLTPPDFGATDHFGHSVAVDPSATGAVIGAPAADFGRGLVWTYTRATPVWSLPAAPLESGLATEEGGAYGSSVATSDSPATVIVGAPETGNGSGTALVFGSGTRFVRMSSFGTAATAPQSGIEAWASFEAEVTGTVTWKWYGPNAATCSGTPLSTLTSTVIPGVGFSATNAILPTHGLGTYLLVASYSGDEHTAPTTSGCGADKVEVKEWPTLVATVAPSTHVGTPIQITPQVRGLEPTGTILMLVFANAGCSGVALTEQTVQVASDGTSPTIEFTPMAPGRLYIYAQYSGDSRNFGISNGEHCQDAGAVVVNRAEPALEVSAPLPRAVGEPISATARLRDGYQPSGAIRFSLFPPSDPGCSGNPTATVSTPEALDRVASSGSFAESLAGIYRFRAEYGGDANNMPSSTACGSASVEVTRRHPTLDISGLADAAGYGTIEGTASLHGAFLPTGNIAVSLFRASQRCRGRPLITVLTALNDGLARTGALGPVPAGIYGFVGSYSGDQDNEPFSTACGAARIAVPPILERATLTSQGARVVLRCTGVAGKRCSGTITGTVGRHVLIRSHYAIPKGRTRTRVLRLDAGIVHPTGTAYLELTVQLTVSEKSETIQHLRLRLRSR
jgi:hypothetical protein